ncbi:MAG: RNase P subunit p30 family protein [Thermofilum sp.]
MPRRKLYDAFAGGFRVEDIEEGEDRVSSILEQVIRESKRSMFRGCLPVLMLDSYGARTARAAAAASSLVEKVAARENYRCYLRCHVYARSLSEVKRLVAGVRKHCVIVSVESTSREITAFACRDRRVDIVTVVPGVTQAIPRGDLLYAIDRGRIFELTLSHLLGGDKLEIARRLSSTLPVVRKLTQKGLPLILSSGPRLPYTPASYRATLSFAKEVLEVPTDVVARSMGPVLESRIRQNLEKISGLRPVEGVIIES